MKKTVKTVACLCAAAIFLVSCGTSAKTPETLKSVTSSKTETKGTESAKASVTENKSTTGNQNFRLCFGKNERNYAKCDCGNRSCTTG